MFKLTPDATFKATVAIPVPGGEARTIEIEFKWLSREAFAEHCKAAATLRDAPFLAALMVGWDADEPYTEEALGKLLGNFPKAGRAIFTRYQDELLGVEEKN